MNTNDISPKILANMQANYSGLLKAGATNLGTDNMSKSIFAKIDADGNGSLTQIEIDTAMPSLSDILKNAAANAKDFARTMFGGSENEQMVDKNIENTCNRIIQYAKEHPEDERIQKYAAKIQELFKNGNLTSTDSLPLNIVAKHNAGWSFNEQILLNNNRIRLRNDEDYVLLCILHELGHAESGDALDSISEERDVESYAREITQKIAGKKTDEFLDGSIDEFMGIYAALPKSSPGYNGIPKNAGVTIDYEIESVKRDGNNYIIKSEPNENGGYIETVIVMGQNTDIEGNLIPESAKEIMYDSGGNELGTTDIREYNLQKKRFVNYPNAPNIDDNKDKMPEIKLKQEL